jgi:sugar lactone lactonase YvrE
MKAVSFLCPLWFALCCWEAEAQIYDTNNEVVQTFAGSGFSGYLDGQGTLTMFNTPSQIIADSSGNLFVAENARIRKITTNAAVSTFVGGGAGSLPGYGTNIGLAFGGFNGMAFDRSNTLWLTSGSTSSLIRIGGDGYTSITNLPGIGSALNGICVDSGNNIYLSASYMNQIFRWRTNGTVEVFAGSGNSGSSDGNGLFTSFNLPCALAADAADNIYVWDLGNFLIRRINQNRDVVTIAGRGYSDSDGVGMNAAFSSISSMCVDNSGNLILACGSSIRKITARTNVVTMAGSSTQTGYTNGTGNLARFNSASGVCLSQGSIFVADTSNQRIRTITFNPAPQLVSGADLNLSMYPGLQIAGTVGRTYQIQSSPDMTNWTTRASLLLTSSPYLWFDQNAVSGNKFYRAFLLP